MTAGDQTPDTASLLPEERVGAALRLAREEARLSLREMARRLNYNSHSMLSSYEKGSVMPSDAVVEGYERVLGLQGELTRVLEEARVDRHGDAWAKRRAHFPAPGVPLDATSEEPPPVWRLSRPRPVIVTASVLGLAALAALVNPWDKPPEPKAAASAFGSIQVRDGADPEDSGCARDPGVVLLDTTEVDYEGLPAGSAQLKYSPACGVSWPRFEPFTRGKIPTHAAIHVDLVRPDDGDQRTAFEAPFVGEPVFGNVLLSTSKCVYAAVRIGGTSTSVPEVHTHCFRGRTYER